MIYKNSQPKFLLLNQPKKGWTSILFLFIFQCSQAQLKFLPNKGQWHSKYKYSAQLMGGRMFLEDSGLLFTLIESGASEQLHKNPYKKITAKGHNFRLEFLGANFSSITEVGDKTDEYYNFYLGNDSSKWKTGVYGVFTLMVHQIYPGVDLRLYSNGNDFKYDLICKDWTDIAKVKIRYAGIENPKLAYDKIILPLSFTTLSDAMPMVSAMAGTDLISLKAHYKEVEKGVFSFNVQKPGRTVKQIQIDPILVFSTFSGSIADNFGCTGTYDELGNGYAGGTVFENNLGGLPVTLGAFQRNFGGGTVEPGFGYGDERDAAILKFNTTGRTLLFCTYLGGSGNEQPHSMVTDSVGNLYVMGSTKSPNFPTSNTAYQRLPGGKYDIFVSKFNPTGTQLLASTYFGAAEQDGVIADRNEQNINSFPLLYNYADEFRGEIITENGNIYVNTTCYSSGLEKGSGRLSYQNNSDALVFSFNGTLSSLRWSTYLGGSEFDAGYGIAIGDNDDLYVAGGSNSRNLSSNIPNFRTPSYLGGIADGFLVRINKNTGEFLTGTFAGTSNYDQCYFVQTDNSGRPYIYGVTEGTIPQINAIFHQVNRGQFIQRFSTDLRNIEMSASFGGSDFRPNLSPTAFLIDRCERIFVSGWGGPSTNSNLEDEDGIPKAHRNMGNTNNMPITPNATQSNTDGNDFWIGVFARDMRELTFGTYFGGISNATRTAHEHVDGGTSRFDKKGIIYQSICAGCGGNARNGLFPTTANAYSRAMRSQNCNNALVKLDFENLNKKPAIQNTYVEVTATEPIDITISGNDPDPYDTLFFITQWIQRGKLQSNDTPTFSITDDFGNVKFGIGNLKLKVNWATKCSSWSKDTLILKVLLFDRGCPKADTSEILLKILVKEPPKIIPSDAVCVSFDRPTGRLKIDWPATTQPSKFFKYFLLKRRNPDGSITVLDTIRNADAGSRTDWPPTDPYSNDYCYFLTGRNTCDQDSTLVNIYCTVSELNNPIFGTDMHFATVLDDKKVMSSWFRSNEPDFKEYEIHRYKRGTLLNTTLKPYDYTKDTFYIDSNLNVDAESYCYAIVVTDKCGHYSRPSTPGCNIVITGTKKGRPDYYFDLNWQNYQFWKNGASFNVLQRQYNTVPFTPIVTLDTNNLSYRDDKLDFDWGSYNYRVEATENPPYLGSTAAKSMSNTINLWQAPELWVPNAFTLNFDNLNDVWGTVPVFVKNYHMRVYNRWGEKVWESTQKKLQWDGFKNGKISRDAVFAWYVVFDGWDGKTYKMSGTVTVLH